MTVQYWPGTKSPHSGQQVVRHRAPREPFQWRRVVIPLVVGVLLAVAVVSVAQARPVQPRSNEGWIALTQRVCGSSYGWQQVKADNGGGAWLYLGVTYNVTCYRPDNSKASRTSTRTPTKAAWVKPGPGGCGDGFGYRSWRPGEFHQGQDIRTGYGARVVSIAAGKVTAAGWSGGAGRRVWVDHGHGVRSIVMHLASIAVRVGQTVKAGQLLGRSGSSGDSTGPHLHVGITVNGKYVAPKTFMANKGVRLC